MIGVDSPQVGEPADDAKPRVQRLSRPVALWQPRGTKATIAATILVTAAYFGSAKLGLSLAFSHSSVSAIWPPSGLALAAVLLGGYRMLPAVALGAFLANFTSSAPLGAVLAITVGNTLEAFVGAALLKRTGFRGSLERMRDVVAIVALAAVVSTAVSATVGIAGLTAFGGLPGAQAPGTWRIWWLGDMGGDLLVGTALLVFAATPMSWFKSRRAAEALVLTLLLAGLSVIVLSHGSAFAYLVFPLLFLLALLYRQRGAVLGGMIVSAIAVWFTARGHGPFVGSNLDANLVRAQTFVSVGAITSLLVAAAKSERHVAELALGRLADSERALADAQRLARIGSFEWDLRANKTIWSDQLYRIVGLNPADSPASYDSWRNCTHEDDRAMVDTAVWKAYEECTPFSFVHRVVRPDGNVRTLECRGRVEVDASGLRVRMMGTEQDVTAMRLAEERFRSLFETAPYARVIVDATGEIELVNSPTERLFGYTREELIGKHVEELMPSTAAALRPWYRELIDRAPSASAKSGEFDLHAYRKDGSEFPVEISLTPLITEEGTLVSATVEDITERKLAADALTHQASHDALTGLPNRTLFLDRLEHALGRANRSKRKLAVVFLDLDDFKLVNDTRGHEVGDLLLVALTPKLSAALRPGDTIARFGGDEFVVLCEDLSAESDAICIANRISDACSTPIVIGGHEHVVTVSAGIFMVDNPETATASGVLRDADAAMYRAKADGKGRVELFDDGMRARLLERIAIESSLRSALERGELRLFYQPVLSLEDCSIVAAEALLRWQHPQRGLLAPSEFIPIAESSGLIVQIGEWVLEEACRQAAAWRDAAPGVDPVHVSVNLAPRQLAHSDIAASVARILRTTGLEASLLEVEITESMLLEDAEGRARALGQLKALGVHLVLDDFGTGHSSLSDLKRLAIDTLKIDRSFVDGLGRDSEDSAIVSAVLSMASALDLGVIAEGVETRSQLSRLREHGCEFAQGFLFSAPATAAEVADLLGAAAERERLTA
jgi:diguanylate cyclase (GGDEF)-like protein/PAS domain S-box-containing protein